MELTSKFVNEMADIIHKDRMRNKNSIFLTCFNNPNFGDKISIEIGQSYNEERLITEYECNKFVDYIRKEILDDSDLEILYKFLHEARCLDINCDEVHILEEMFQKIQNRDVPIMNKLKEDFLGKELDSIRIMYQENYFKEKRIYKNNKLKLYFDVFYDIFPRDIFKTVLILNMTYQDKIPTEIVNDFHLVKIKLNEALADIREF